MPDRKPAPAKERHRLRAAEWHWRLLGRAAPAYVTPWIISGNVGDLHGDDMALLPSASQLIATVERDALEAAAQLAERTIPPGFRAMSQDWRDGYLVAQREIALAIRERGGK